MEILLSNLNLLTIAWCAGIVCYCYKNCKSKTGNKSDYTTWGMLGTFVGIALGLLSFDASNINNSIPQLLSGLTLAFWTSIVGLVCSIVHAHKSKTWEITEDSPTDELLKTIAQNIKVLGEDKEGSIIGQLKLLRVEFGDLRNEFGDFAKKVADSSAKSATKAIVEALTNVVKDFNEKITEQFGDNFKQLNEAVGKLLDWQQEYKEYMEKFKDNLDLVSSAIDKNSEAVKNLPKALEQIKEIIQKTDDEIVRITESLSDMDDMGKTAKETLPEAISEIKRVADNAIRQTNGLSDKALAFIQNTTTVVSDNSEAVMAHTKKLIDNTGTQINAMSEESITKIDDVSKKAFGAITEMGDKAAQVVPDMKKSLNNMLEETNNELESLGGHIVGITQKLVSNFQELSDTLEVATKKNK